MFTARSHADLKSRAACGQREFDDSIARSACTKLLPHAQGHGFAWHAVQEVSQVERINE